MTIPEPTRAAFAHTSGHYASVVAVFVGLLVVSNVAATKLIAVGPLITDGGALLFPLVYVLGDVLSEVYGWPATRRAIWLAFGMSALAAGTFLLVGAAPPAGHGPHRYVFTVFAVDVPRLDVTPENSGAVFGFNLHFHTLAKATLTATYENAGEG